MNGKRVFILLIMIILLGVPMTEAAEESQQSAPAKVKVTCLHGFVGSEGNDATKGYKALFDNFKSRCAVTFSGDYEFVDGAIYMQKFAEKGIHDFLYLEKDCITEEFKNTTIDHVLVITRLQSEGSRMMYHLKVIDVKKNKYEYVGSFSRSDFFQGATSITNKTYNDIEETVFLKLFPKINVVRS